MVNFSIEALNESHYLLNSFKEACVALDNSSCILLLNQKAEKLFSCIGYATVGKYIWELFPETFNSAGVAAINQAIHDRQPGRVAYHSSFFDANILLQTFVTAKGIILLINREGQGLANGSKVLVQVRSPAKRPVEAPAIRKYKQLLARQKKQLRQHTLALQRRDEFISIASHELKTPITALRMHAELLLDAYEAHADAFLKNSLNTINDQIIRLVEMIDLMLDVTRLNGDQLDLTLTTVDLPAVIKDAMLLLTPGSGHQFILSGVQHCEVQADQVRMQQVVRNLLSNAIRYSPNANKILIHIDTSPDLLTFSIRDFGIGMEAEHLNRIFERFYRIRDKPAGPAQGLGIGLYVVSEIVKKHQGKLWVESEPGKGSTFYCSIPLTRSADKKA
jgi:signal transduction histidine kinase